MEEMLPYGNSQKLSNLNNESKFIFLITFLCHFYDFCPMGKEGGSFIPRTIKRSVNLNPAMIVQEKSIMRNDCRNYSVSLLIIGLHSLLPTGGQVVSLCVHVHSLGGSVDDGVVLFFFFCSEEQDDKESRAGSIFPLQLRCTYTNIGIGKINDQHQLSHCLLLSGRRRRKGREGKLVLQQVYSLCSQMSFSNLLVTTNQITGP